MPINYQNISKNMRNTLIHGNYYDIYWQKSPYLCQFVLLS